MAMLWLGNMFNVKAADKFVSFSPANDAWQLHDITLGYAAGEHSCVQRAAASLATDFEQVTHQQANRPLGKTGLAP